MAVFSIAQINLKILSTSKFGRICFLLLVLMLNACSTVREPNVIQIPAPAVVEERVITEPGTPLPEEPIVLVEPLPSGPTMSPAAQSLLARSDTQTDEGDWDSAANSLERALRLEPNNALLWSRLAGIRYQQEDWQQAVQLAAKSNTLAARDENLRRRNWNMMANAYDQLGDAEAAQKYRQQLTQ